MNVNQFNKEVEKLMLNFDKDIMDLIPSNMLKYSAIAFCSATQDDTKNIDGFRDLLKLFSYLYENKYDIFMYKYSADALYFMAFRIWHFVFCGENNENEDYKEFQKEYSLPTTVNNLIEMKSEDNSYKWEIIFAYILKPKAPYRELVFPLECVYRNIPVYSDGLRLANFVY